MLLGATLAVAAMAPAAASASGTGSGSGSGSGSANGAVPADGISCPTQVELTQPFQSFGDTNEYALLSGQDADSFDPTGWQLGPGATVEPAIVEDGTPGSVLDLSGRAQAISPVLCVDASYPDLRVMVANLAGWEGVTVEVQMYDHGAWQSPLAMGTAKSFLGTGFTPSRDLQIHTASLRGSGATRTVPARFILTGRSSFSGAAQEYQVYRVGIDPRMKG